MTLMPTRTGMLRPINEIHVQWGRADAEVVEQPSTLRLSWIVIRIYAHCVSSYIKSHSWTLGEYKRRSCRIFHHEQQPYWYQWIWHKTLFVALPYHRFWQECRWLTIVMPDPDDETLKAALHQYAKEKLSTNQRLARLEAEHNLTIKFVIHTFQFAHLLKIHSDCKTIKIIPAQHQVRSS